MGPTKEARLIGLEIADVRITTLDLKRSVRDSEFVPQLLGDFCDEGITGMPFRHHQMAGERSFSSAHWLDVEVVDACHPDLTS